MLSKKHKITRPRTDYNKKEQGIQGSDDEAKCAIAWLDMRWPKQVNKL